MLFISKPTLANNKKLFEGYYKITKESQHVGYYIQRYELDTVKKQFISTYFLRTNQLGGNISESLKAYSTETLLPLKYQYTSLQGSSSKTIDANVRKDKRGHDVLQVKVNEDGKLRVFEQKMEKGTFLSTFLIYLLLQGEKGIKPGIKYEFKAIAEEDGKPYSGDVFIDSEQKALGLDAFKILYTFKKTQFVNFINAAGEALITVSPALQLSAELVADTKIATKDMIFNEKSLSLLFGNIPEGKTHQLNDQKNITPTSNLSPKEVPPVLKPATDPTPKAKNNE